MMVLAVALLVGGCEPATWYTAAEAPKRLQVDSSTTQLVVRFAPGTGRLAPVDAARLRQLVANGGISPSDRVTVAAGGSSWLADQRVAAVSSLLVHYGIAVDAQRSAAVPPDRAIVQIGRSLVTLPPCPNWSKRSQPGNDNQPSSNFGCATETNLGMMVANPSDLASGMPGGPSEGQPAAAAVNRYLNDKVVLPASNGALPIPAAQSTQTPSTPSSGSQ
jgi:pilus assembly protein CpaD